MPAKKQRSERKAKPSGQVVGRSLDPVVGFWVEMVPIEQKPTQEEFVDFAKRLATPSATLDYALDIHFGIGDHRRPFPLEDRRSLCMFNTRAEAKRAGEAESNDMWTYRVRIARKANPALQATGGGNAH